MSVLVLVQDLTTSGPPAGRLETSVHGSPHVLKRLQQQLRTIMHINPPTGVTNGQTLLTKLPTWSNIATGMSTIRSH